LYDKAFQNQIPRKRTPEDLGYSWNLILDLGFLWARMPTPARSYTRFTAAETQDLIDWFTELDEDGFYTNYKNWMGGAKLPAAARIIQTKTRLQISGHSREKVRDKLFQLVKSYREAKDWYNQTGQGVLEEDGEETVMGKHYSLEELFKSILIEGLDTAVIRRKCPHYDAFDEVIGSNVTIQPPIQIDSLPLSLGGSIPSSVALVGASLHTTGMEEDEYEASSSCDMSPTSEQTPIYARSSQSRTRNTSRKRRRADQLDVELDDSLGSSSVSRKSKSPVTGFSLSEALVQAAQIQADQAMNESRERTRLAELELQLRTKEIEIMMRQSDQHEEERRREHEQKMKAFDLQIATLNARRFID
jgi:hypothetical protein